MTSLSADGGSITLQPQYSAFIGSELSSLINADTFYRGYFGQGGQPTQKFRDAIVLVGAPAGMRVTGATIDPPLPERARRRHGATAIARCTSPSPGRMPP